MNSVRDVQPSVYARTAMPTAPPLPPTPPVSLDYANPYARAGVGSGAHAEGALIVAPPVVDLPRRCVFCNEPEAKRLMMKYSWHHPALYLLILPGILIYAIVAMVLQKKATVGMSICSLHAARRGRKRLIFWLVVPLMMSLIVIGPVLDSNRMIHRDFTPMFIIVGVLGSLISLVVASQSGRLLKAKFIDDKMVKLAGGGRPFLDSLGDAPAMPAVPIAQPVY